jgi:clan AA aspartic protease
MINGTVAPSLHPCIPLDVQADDGTYQTIEAAVDTAFTGFLALPEARVALLGLPWVRQGRSTLADGTVVTVEIHMATIVWDGTPRSVLVEAGGPLPLVGTALLSGHKLSVHFEIGGPVVIEAVP